MDDAALASAVGVALAASCDNTCEGYRSMWEDMLSDCIDFSTAPGIALMDELLEICKGGGDENNPFGAGSLPGSNTTTNGNRNFAEVLIYHLGSGAIDGDCNADIIGLPLAYGHPYFGGNITNGIAPGPDLVVNGNFSNGTQVFSNTFKTDLVLSYLTIDNSCPADPLSPGSPYASSNFNIDASISSQATPLDNTYNSSVQNNISLDYIYAISPWNYQWKHYESGIDCPPNVQHRYTIASDPYKLNTSWPSPPPGKRDFAMVVSGAPSYSAYSPNTSLYENCNSGTNDHWYVWQQEIEVDCNTTYIFQVDVMGLHDDGGAILSLMAGCEELSGAADIQVSSTSFWNWTTITGTWYSGNCTGTQDVSISIIEKSFRTGMATGSFAIDSIRFYSRGDDCADCIQVESAQSAFLTQYGSSIVNETNYQVMFQNYLNEELHLNLSYWEYADFLAVCAGNDTASLCNESMFRRSGERLPAGLPGALHE